MRCAPTRAGAAGSCPAHSSWVTSFTTWCRILAIRGAWRWPRKPDTWGRRCIAPTIAAEAGRKRPRRRRFARPRQAEPARAVERVFWLTPGHVSEPGTWYAGTAPAGLFRSEDHGANWAPVAGFNDHPMNAQWAPGSGTPDGELLHSILIDPRDPKHLYLAISIGGVFESTDGGADWAPLNEGVAADFLPDPNAAYGHDPHCVLLHPQQPDRLYQQNHCGIYRLDRPSRLWLRIGARDAREAHWRHRFSDGAAPARPGHRLGATDGWHSRCGRAPRWMASRPYIAAAMPAGAGGALIAGCHARRPGLRCCARPCAPTAARPGLFWHHRRRGLGQHQRRRKLARCSAPA